MANHNKIIPANERPATIVASDGAVEMRDLQTGSVGADHNVFDVIFRMPEHAERITLVITCDKRI